MSNEARSILDFIKENTHTHKFRTDIDALKDWCKRTDQTFTLSYDTHRRCHLITIHPKDDAPSDTSSKRNESSNH